MTATGRIVNIKFPFIRKFPHFAAFAAIICAALLALAEPARAEKGTFADVSISSGNVLKNIEVQFTPGGAVTDAGGGSGASFSNVKLSDEETKRVAARISYDFYYENPDPLNDDLIFLHRNVVEIDWSRYASSIRVRGSLAPGPNSASFSGGGASAIATSYGSSFDTNAAFGAGLSETDTTISGQVVNNLQTDPGVYTPFPPVQITLSVRQTEVLDPETGIKKEEVADLENKIYETWIAGLMEMTEQLTAVALFQMEILGTFFDARQHLETQRTFRKLTARAWKDYHPGEALCQVGTFSKGLAGSHFKMRANQHVINQAILGRELSKPARITGTSRYYGDMGRVALFKAHYCDMESNGVNGLMAFCEDEIEGDERINLDVDYTRLMDTRATLNADFTDTAQTRDEVDILTLGRRLYAREAMTNIVSGKFHLEGASDEFMDMRTVFALRGAARNSFASLVSMKSAGTPAAGQYMKTLLKQIGLSEDEAKTYLGGADASTPLKPSYYAQMDILARKAMQDPAFVANLYDSPANVKRQRALMYSLKLMQGRDKLESLQRRELMLSLILELKIRALQKQVEGFEIAR